MDRELEVRTGLRIDAALRRIQSNVYRIGTAGAWHIGKASDILQSPELLQRYVAPLGEDEQAVYLDRLPALIAKTQQQDERCQDLWHSCSRLSDTSSFKAERRALLRLFRNFQLHPKQFDRLVRQPDKPLSRRAIDLLTADHEASAEIAELEAIVRLRLREFVALEEHIVDDIHALDAARGELSAAHEWLARRIAEERRPLDANTLASAMMGLHRAASSYDYKRGFAFPEYAEHWIQAAIGKQ